MTKYKNTDFCLVWFLFGFLKSSEQFYFILNAKYSQFLKKISTAGVSYDKNSLLWLLAKFRWTMFFRNPTKWCKKKSYHECVRFFEQLHNVLSIRDRKKFFCKKYRFFSRVRENMGCQKFRPPKSSMGSYFRKKIPKKRSFFWIWGCYGFMRGAQQHNWTRQYFGGHVA